MVRTIESEIDTTVDLNCRSGGLGYQTFKYDGHRITVDTTRQASEINVGPITYPLAVKRTICEA